MRHCHACSRHVLLMETACPFCDSPLRSVRGPSPLLVGALLGLTLAACGDKGGGNTGASDSASTESSATTATDSATTTSASASAGTTMDSTTGNSTTSDTWGSEVAAAYGDPSDTWDTTDSETGTTGSDTGTSTSTSG